MIALDGAGAEQSPGDGYEAPPDAWSRRTRVVCGALVVTAALGVWTTREPRLSAVPGQPPPADAAIEEAPPATSSDTNAAPTAAVDIARRHVGRKCTKPRPAVRPSATTHAAWASSAGDGDVHAYSRHPEEALHVVYTTARWNRRAAAAVRHGSRWRQTITLTVPQHRNVAENIAVEYWSTRLPGACLRAAHAGGHDGPLVLSVEADAAQIRPRRDYATEIHFSAPHDLDGVEWVYHEELLAPRHGATAVHTAPRPGSVGTCRTCLVRWAQRVPRHDRSPTARRLIHPSRPSREQPHDSCRRRQRVEVLPRDDKYNPSAAWQVCHELIQRDVAPQEAAIAAEYAYVRHPPSTNRMSRCDRLDPAAAERRPGEVARTGDRRSPDPVAPARSCRLSRR